MYTDDDMLKLASKLTGTTVTDRGEAVSILLKATREVERTKEILNVKEHYTITLARSPDEESPMITKIKEIQSDIERLTKEKAELEKNLK